MGMLSIREYTLRVCTVLVSPLEYIQFYVVYLGGMLSVWEYTWRICCVSEYTS